MISEYTEAHTSETCAYCGMAGSLAKPVYKSMWRGVWYHAMHFFKPAGHTSPRRVHESEVHAAARRVPAAFDIR